eukprot:jgi/Chlat1/5968/Chrsp4S06289
MGCKTRRQNASSPRTYCRSEALLSMDVATALYTKTAQHHGAWQNVLIFDNMLCKLVVLRSLVAGAMMALLFLQVRQQERPQLVQAQRVPPGTPATHVKLSTPRGCPKPLPICPSGAAEGVWHFHLRVTSLPSMCEAFCNVQQPCHTSVD